MESEVKKLHLKINLLSIFFELEKNKKILKIKQLN